MPDTGSTRAFRNENSPSSSGVATKHGHAGRPAVKRIRLRLGAGPPALTLGSVRVPFIGGTGPVGQSSVPDLLAAGHEVAVAHSGAHEPGCLAALEHLHAWSPDCSFDTADPRLTLKAPYRKEQTPQPTSRELAPPFPPQSWRREHRDQGFGAGPRQRLRLHQSDGPAATAHRSARRTPARWPCAATQGLRPQIYPAGPSVPSTNTVAFLASVPQAILERTPSCPQRG